MVNALPLHVVSFSELNTFRTCPHRWDLTYRQNWVVPEKPDARSRGKLWHVVMREHYKSIKNGVPAEDIVTYIKREHLYTESGEQTEEQELVEWMYDGYFECWREEDKRWKIVAVEQRVEVPLPPYKDGKAQFVLKGFIDLVLADEKDRVWVVDHKTGRNFPTELMLGLNDQFGLYCWAWRLVPGGPWVHGVMHNHARTQRNKGPMELDNRFQRYLTYRTDEELEKVATEAWQTANRAYALGPDEAERTPDADKCRWCDYREPCLAGRKGVDEDQYLRDLGCVQLAERIRH